MSRQKKSQLFHSHHKAVRLTDEWRDQQPHKKSTTTRTQLTPETLARWTSNALTAVTIRHYTGTGGGMRTMVDKYIPGTIVYIHMMYESTRGGGGVYTCIQTAASSRRGRRQKRTSRGRNAPMNTMKCTTTTAPATTPKYLVPSIYSARYTYIFRWGFGRPEP